MFQQLKYQIIKSPDKIQLTNQIHIGYQLNTVYDQLFLSIDINYTSLGYNY